MKTVPLPLLSRLRRDLRFWATLMRALWLIRRQGRRAGQRNRRPFRLLSLMWRRGRHRARQIKALGVPIPSLCMFSVTWKCNLRCKGCYAANYSPGSEIDLEVISRVLGEATALGVHMFVVVGGEPLMVEGLVETLAATPNAVFFLFTNGTLLTDRHVESIAASGNIMPVVSFEGTREEMILRRGERAYRATMAAMERFRKAGVPFGISAMVTSRNVRAVVARKWFDEAWEYGARLAVLLDYVPVDTGADLSLVLSAEDRALKEREMKARFREARPIVVNFPPDEYQYGGCRSAGRGFIHINADGHVEPCPFCHYAAHSVRDMPLAEILKSEFFAHLRRESDCWENPDRTCLLAANRDRVQKIAAETGAFFTEKSG